MANPPNLRAIAAQDAARYGVPVNVFLRQIGAESNWDPGARSPAGAEGIAQFMPGTAAGYHIDPSNPVQALDAAARMDAGNIKKYGSVARALSAYNSGRPDAYLDPQFAGGETSRYVQKILGGAGNDAPAPAAPAMGQAPAGPAPLGRGNPRTEFALAIAQNIGRKMDVGTLGGLVNQLHQGLQAEQQPAMPAVDQSGAPTGATMQSGFAFPVAGGPHPFSNDWGNPRVGHTHAGIDIPAAEGTPLVAVQNGVITAAGPSGAAGNRIWLNGKFFYAHLSKFAVKPGDHVKAGQVIGYVGATGDATGPHLHFGWSPDASQGVSWANPYQLLTGVAGGHK